MVKISVLQHDLSSHTATRPGDPTPVSRNLNPLVHPFSRARERTRALNAAKMDRMFAKPFVGALEGHVDAVEVLAKQGDSISTVASGSWDGGVIVHNLSQRTQMARLPQGHKGKVTGLSFAGDSRLLSCGVDCNVKLWKIGSVRSSSLKVKNLISILQDEPVNVFPGKYAFNSIDHQRFSSIFATASTLVQIWDETKSVSHIRYFVSANAFDRSAPISNLTFPTSTETISSVRFNLSESSILASVGSDRTFTLYDIRTGKAERRVVMQMRANALSWSPTFPTNILLASEDHNLYTFDIRHLDAPSLIYKGHVAAVMSCDWSPTGTEFVSGGWDRTVRIWQTGQGHSPEVYHTKRMQRVTSTLFTTDARFVLSGSDDGNVRIWKGKASERLGIVTARERAAVEYRSSLVDRWKMDKEVGKVVRTRHLPKPVYTANKLKNTMLESKRVKEERRRKHTRAGESKPKPERKKVVLVEQT